MMECEIQQRLQTERLNTLYKQKERLETLLASIPQSKQRKRK